MNSLMLATTGLGVFDVYNRIKIDNGSTECLQLVVGRTHIRNCFSPLALQTNIRKLHFSFIISYQRVNMKIETSKHIFLHIVLSCMCVTDSYWYPNTKIVCTVLHF